ncbi:uncharacterized protein LOC111088914 [Limulus polyphemus]|uniref:Uncharacterized protein LOC111088914 n=1 Tax=Limulus polyphemus TaxID=6850 RepID=A0ABM1TJ65_LIMPO|nr:uncharacterized protein LOC111088914 [Limulus polyphemus]
MPFLHIETTKRLCNGAEMVLQGKCNHSLTASNLQDPTHRLRVVFSEQSTDALIYVAVVVFFYASVIIILVGTNLHRFQGTRFSTSSGNKEKQKARQLVVQVDGDGQRYKTTTNPEIEGKTSV